MECEYSGLKSGRSKQGNPNSLHPAVPRMHMWCSLSTPNGHIAKSYLSGNSASFTSTFSWQSRPRRRRPIRILLGGPSRSSGQASLSPSFASLRFNSPEPAARPTEQARHTCITATLAQVQLNQCFQLTHREGPVRNHPTTLQTATRRPLADKCTAAQATHDSMAGRMLPPMWMQDRICEGKYSSYR